MHKKKRSLDPADKNYLEACKIIGNHPMFAPLESMVSIARSESDSYPNNGYAIVSEGGYIHVHPKRYAEVNEWVYILAHCLLHLGFEHFKRKHRQDLWNIACDVYIATFLEDFKLGMNPNGGSYIIRDLHIQTEEHLYDFFLDQGLDKRLLSYGTGNPGQQDMIFEPHIPSSQRDRIDWGKYFSQGLRDAVASAVNVAGGVQKTLSSVQNEHTNMQQARRWFINSYPLLGSLAAGIDLIENQEVCRQMDIAMAAVDAKMREIYFNPTLCLTMEESKFVLAHELLHIGLRHDYRSQGRDPFLWNAACDFVINDWLVEMQLGDMPAIGVLYDPKLKGESAEAVYDILTTDLRRMRKLMTFRGVHKGDMIDPQMSEWWAHASGVDLDHFYRRCLMQGLEYHCEQERGLLPAALIEEIKASDHPPIPWDVELAKWFDEYFPPLEKIRSYAKPSRRQSGCPDIPRPQYVPQWEAGKGRTFGVVLDTSISMDRALLARALGAITSYSLSRDVNRIRLVFCDATPYDQGYVTPEDLCERVQVKGRGGTILQPGVNLLQKAEDFPKNGPILIITDGMCDKLIIHRDHAFLIPPYGMLPFKPKGKIFRIH